MTLTDQVRQLLTDALKKAQAEGELPDVEVDEVIVERPQNEEHGDFASSTPMKLARVMRKNPFDIAEAIASSVATDDIIASATAARPGFVNLSLSPTWLAEQVEVIRRTGDSFGAVDDGKGTRVQVEFVSVNPTGPIHVGHARGAVFGSALASVLDAAGYEVQREYYINDAGNQMDKFNQSVYARYLQASGREAEVPADGYQGDYMVDLASQLKNEFDGKFLDIDEEQATREIGEIGMNRMVDAIRTDMSDLQVGYDEWFSERSLFDTGQFDTAMAMLDEKGLLIERDGAKWFAATKLGDDEDKVLVRSNGLSTYFASDVAYHYNKFRVRGFDRVINIWGADHQGQVPFMKALADVLDVDRENLVLLLYQLVTLKRGGEVVRLSKRAGDIITLRELVEEVGSDACRFFFLQRSPDSQMEFDIDLAKEQSEKNPVYYIQYAHARMASILRLAKERGIDFSEGDVALLSHEAELSVIRKMLQLPDLVSMMARSLEPHHLTYYSMELATEFHNFYHQCRVVSSDPADAEITRARLKLVEGTKVVLARCLSLMGMNAPDEM
jgi:arginyl-tRNA synthetase